MSEYLLDEEEVVISEVALEVEQVKAHRNIPTIKDGIYTIVKNACGFFFEHFQWQAKDVVE